MTSALPVIDLSTGHDSALARDFDRALRSWGAFALVNHGVTPDCVDGAFGAARRFFERPLDERLGIRVNKYNRGYVPMHQTVYAGNLPDLKESFNLGWPLPADDPDVVAGKPLHGTNLWPELAGFRTDVEAYFDAMVALGDRMLGPLALCLAMQPAELRALYQRPIAFMRLFHYPPDGRLADREHGAAEHQDYGFLTLLAQDMSGGLEIRTPEGDMIGVPPERGVFVVNAGDMLSRITDGAMRSAPHQVVNRSGAGRYSIPFFYDPGFDARFAGMPDMSAGEFLLAKFNKFYKQGKTYAAAA
jgi:isopenicillin N synthase-like dioxygenase